jgi:hypothetical protein
MITFFEYSDFVVERGRAPAQLCYISGKYNYTGKLEFLAMAERVYSIEGNVLTEIKNRNSVPSTKHISDEDRVVLKLKAVLI